jgi:uncharacterized protein YkwD
MRHVLPRTLLATTVLVGVSLAAPLLRATASEDLATLRKHAERFLQSLADDGFADETKLGLEVFGELGPSEKEVAKLQSNTERALARHRDPLPNLRSLKRHIDTAARIANLTCELGASTPDPVESGRLMELALRMDANCTRANEALGNSLSPEVGWVTPAEKATLDRREAIGLAMNEARRLDFSLEVVTPQDVGLAEVWKGERAAIRHEGLTIESYEPREKLEELYLDFLRAMAFSHWLAHGSLEVHHGPGVVVHIPAERFQDFKLRMKELGRADERDSDGKDNSTLTYIRLPAEIATQEMQHAIALSGSMSRIGARIILHFDRSLDGWDQYGWSDPDPKVPFWLVVGHFNYVTQSFLGQALTGFREHVDSQDTVSNEERRKYLLGHAGIVGCRLWLQELAREGRAPRLAGCMVDQVGKVRDEKKLKSTSVVEYLHEQSRFEEFVGRYRALREAERAATSAVRLPAQRAEDSFGRALPEVELDWESWLLGSSRSSVRGLLEARAQAPVPTDKSAAAVVAELNAVRESMGLNSVSLLEDLSRGAARHAAYLKANSTEVGTWPGAHEERTDLTGFHPEGAWAGAHSVIAYDGPQKCIRQWIDTFYHRVPLTHPGLLRVGFGFEGNVCVLDAGSVVYPSGTWMQPYPFAGQKGVPLNMTPEMPNPVPEREDQRTLGYPITLQLPTNTLEQDIVLSLSTGQGETVPCFFSSPRDPSNPVLAPDGVWCLLPEAPLRPATKYRVRAVWTGGSYEWDFTTGG